MLLSYISFDGPLLTSHTIVSVFILIQKHVITIVPKHMKIQFNLTALHCKCKVDAEFSENRLQQKPQATNRRKILRDREIFCRSILYKSDNFMAYIIPSMIIPFGSIGISRLFGITIGFLSDLHNTVIYSLHMNS